MPHFEKISANASHKFAQNYFLDGGRNPPAAIWMALQLLTPLELDKDSSSSIKVNSNKGDLLKQVDLIVWDEAPMMHKHSFECVDRLLRDITGNDTVFGGKVVLFGGDFRQILPVVVNGNRAQVIAASLKKSYIWDCVETYKLIYNMRLNGPEAVGI